MVGRLKIVKTPSTSRVCRIALKYVVHSLITMSAVIPTALSCSLRIPDKICLTPGVP